MQVYGDRCEEAEPAAFARAINRQVASIERMSAGLGRHSRLVGALIESGRLLQGVADAAFANDRRDRRSAAADDIGGFLVDLARAVWRSWNGASIGRLPRLIPAVGWPATIEMRVPEGFAFYAVYPEAYGEAARRLKLSGTARVIAIRSIGTTLGAVVSAVLDAPPPVTVRPFGDPFAREIALEPELERDLLEGDPHFVIVDEGPGQSGSSFAAVADWLTKRGVAAERIALLPSHAGTPGAAASEQRLRWWSQVQRAPADFGDRWPQLVQRWCAASLGQLDERPQDISAGAWRTLRYDREEDWPPSVPEWERRKFLVSASGTPFLAKFAGLGSIGEEKLAIARALHSEGIVPEPLALAHGFLIERWCAGALSLGRAEKPLREIASHIGARAKLLPATRTSGATIVELLDMAQRNVSIELGRQCAYVIDHWRARREELARRVVRVRTDNRLDRHEWLRLRSGGLLKADALDHHCAHDLIGCQDAAWDVAGAIVEFDVGEMQRGDFIASVEHCAGREIDRELLHFYRMAYLAFRLGQARLGSAMVADGCERGRIERAGDTYSAQLRRLLETRHAATPLSAPH